MSMQMIQVTKVREINPKPSFNWQISLWIYSVLRNVFNIVWLESPTSQKAKFFHAVLLLHDRSVFQ